MRAHLWLSLLALGSSVIGFGQINALQDALPLSKDALLLLPAEQASGNSVEESDWSSDGMFLLIRRRVADYSTRELERMLSGSDTDEPPPRHEIAVYSAITGKTKVLTQINDPVVVEEMSWIPGTSSVIVQTRTIDGNVAHRVLSLLSATGGLSGTLIPDMAADSELQGSPALPYMFLTQHAANQSRATEVRFIGAKGLLGRTAVVPSVGGAIVWRDHGTSLYYVNGAGGKRLAGGWQIDPETGHVTRVEVLPVFTQPLQPVQEVNLVEDRHAVGDGKNPPYAAIVKLASASGPDSIVVTTDGQGGELAPGATAVSYQSRGTLLVRRIVRVPLDYYKNQLRLALRQKALDTAKQLGLSLLMYASDYDDNLPGNGKGWQDKIGPYLNNDDLAAQFNYTYPGGPSSAIQNPATTELGYVDGPDGRAVVYADGHARYIGP
jgi:hypothetical protein